MEGTNWWGTTMENPIRPGDSRTILSRQYVSKGSPKASMYPFCRWAASDFMSYSTGSTRYSLQPMVTGNPSESAFNTVSTEITASMYLKISNASSDLRIFLAFSPFWAISWVTLSDK